MDEQGKTTVTFSILTSPLRNFHISRDVRSPPLQSTYVRFSEILDTELDRFSKEVSSFRPLLDNRLHMGYSYMF